MNSNREVGKGSKPRPTDSKRLDANWAKINWNKTKDSKDDRTNPHRKPNENTQSNEHNRLCISRTDSDTCGSDNSVLRD